jgi:ABC-type transport system involved in multi-copper enzyme maturation permease subunit
MVPSMLSEVRAVLWKEWREHVGVRRGILSASMSMVAVVLLCGIWVGMREAEFVAGWGPVTAGLIGAMMSLLVTPDTFAGERERGTLLALYATPVSAEAMFVGKQLAAGLAAAALALLFGVAGALTLLARGIGLGPLWGWGVLPSAIVFGGVLALFFSALGCIASLRSQTVTQAQQQLFVMTFAVLVLGSVLSIGPLVLLRRFGPDVAWAHESMLTMARLAGGMSPSAALIAGAACLAAFTTVVTMVGIRTLRADRRAAA